DLVSAHARGSRLRGGSVQGGWEEGGDSEVGRRETAALGRAWELGCVCTVIPGEASGFAIPAPKPATTNCRQIPTLASLVRDDTDGESVIPGRAQSAEPRSSMRSAKRFALPS